MPERRSEVAARGSAMCYVANGGMSATVGTQKPSDGPFLNRIFDPKAAVFEGNWHDGREYTLIYAENNDALNYDVIGWNAILTQSNITGSDAVDHTVVDDGRDRAWSPVFLWQSLDPPSMDPSAYINGKLVTCADRQQERFHAESRRPAVTIAKRARRNVAITRATMARPASYHTGGVNVAFGSGRVIFLRENVDYKVFRALMTLYDKKSDSPNKDIVLEEQPYL